MFNFPLLKVKCLVPPHSLTFEIIVFSSLFILNKKQLSQTNVLNGKIDVWRVYLCHNKVIH